MVTEHFKQVYKCPECGNRYEDWDDARECIEEHFDLPAVEDDEMFLYECDFCKEMFEDESTCEEHELEHIEKKDDFYKKFKLKEAGNNPNQSKLFTEVKQEAMQSEARHSSQA